MENNKPKISAGSSMLIIGVSVLIGIVQLAVDLLEFIPVVGTALASIINFFIDLAAFTAFYMMFKIKGVSFSKGRRALTFVGGFILDFIPFVSAFAWTVDVIMVIASVKKEELLAKTPVEASLKEKANNLPGRGGGAVGRRQPFPSNVIQGNFRSNNRAPINEEDEYEKAA